MYIFITSLPVMAVIMLLFLHENALSFLSDRKQFI